MGLEAYLAPSQVMGSSGELDIRHRLQLENPPPPSSKTRLQLENPPPSRKPTASSSKTHCRRARKPASSSKTHRLQLENPPPPAGKPTAAEICLPPSRSTSRVRDMFSVPCLASAYTSHPAYDNVQSPIEEYETPSAEMLFPPTPLQTPIPTPLPGTGDQGM
ncbi:uncharacterized protein A4U43_C04F24690 [Asparagus officinalis]|uniref:Uncharacterized protein n=1 Tax=Asparagus officinalis TaxID=4686 RepID=A0A5P1F8R1_ASPOF|nr:uncharacterized protein A4U43_C04F24690 [Asparagus officinalis]